jgi:transcription antitermination factor NusG
MFPCYLFVKADLEVSTRLLRYAPGVRDFVRVGAFPESLDGSTIEGLKARIGESNVYTPRPRRFEPGERLRICQGGALGGLEVIFERELAGHERVAVLLAEVTLAARLVLSAESLCSIA